MSFRIPAQEPRYMEVYLGNRKTPKRVPLMASLPVKWILRVNAIRRQPEEDQGLAWFEFAVDFFREYVGAEVDNMTAEQVNALFEAWDDANEAEDGASAGE